MGAVQLVSRVQSALLDSLDPVSRLSLGMRHCDYDERIVDHARDDMKRKSFKWELPNGVCGLQGNGAGVRKLSSAPNGILVGIEED